MATASTKYREDLNEVVDKGKDMAKDMMDKGKDAARDVVEKGKEAASSAMQTAGDVAAAVGKKAQQATAAVGSGMQSLGETIHDSGPRGGIPGRVTDTVADALENTGKYLEEHGLSGIAEDVTNLVRRNPIPALLVGIGIGYLIARATRS